jgi:hypothetical protein
MAFNNHLGCTIYFDAENDTTDEIQQNANYPNPSYMNCQLTASLQPRNVSAKQPSLLHFFKQNV